MEQTENIERYYLIDYENVHQAGLNGIEKLTVNDKIIIFYTANAETLTFSLYEKMVRCKAEIQLYKVQCGGKNALDFQLATFLGYVLGNNPDSVCHIISNDKGYEYVRNFWKEKNIEVKMSSDISGKIHELLPVVVPALPVPKTEPIETDFDKAVKPLNLSDKNKKKLRDIYNNAMKFEDAGKMLTQINNAIGVIFGSSNQKEYYAALKPLVK